ncbi:thioredoxin-like protein [Xylaria nigripes]|nr:thioredoxin-like protein [Xylaria nigripes]
MTSTAANSNPTPAQEEFQRILDNSVDKGSRVHPEDKDDRDGDSEQDEEDRYREAQISEAMRAPAMRSGEMNLPPASFDSGRATGVKGVIADARAYEQARRGKRRNKVGAGGRSAPGVSHSGHTKGTGSPSPMDSEDDDADEEEFLHQWREARRLELETEARKTVRSRRTSPSPPMFGRFDSVDALGYLDAIEKVNRDTTVVVFVYDHQCEVSGMMELAMRPLVISHPHIHFVKVHYEDVEFDNAAVPAILGYRNQGDLFANLTGIIDIIPEDEDFDTDALKRVLQKNGIL